MPTRAARTCNYPACPGLAEVGAYCADHARVAEDARPSASSRGYGRSWRKLREMQLRRSPLCVDPFAIHDGRPVAATDVDHILARRHGGRDALANLQSLCHSCHSRKTSQERWRGGGGGAISANAPT